ncbi:hypothetical protein MMC07_002026 [Pseudocyphellaria aurata]|nr:hypothetical protein [Pseudocyphellaria aurata]
MRVRPIKGGWFVNLDNRVLLAFGARPYINAVLTFLSHPVQALGGVPFRDDEDTSDKLTFLNPPESTHMAHTQPLSPSHAPGFRIYVLTIVLSLVFLLEIGGTITIAPSLRILESILCRNYYREFNPSRIGKNGEVEEKYCKIDEVQGLMVYLNGWDDFFSHLPGLFLAIPFGLAADKYGRKWVMVLGVTSVFLRTSWTYAVFAFPHIFPIRLMWLQGVLTIFGGGPAVTTALFWVVTTDVSSEAERATTFYYAHSLFYATFLLGPPVSSLLMDRNPWIPMNIGLAVSAFSVIVVLFLPETQRVANALGDGVDLKNDTEISYADSPTSECPPRPILPTFRNHKGSNPPVDFSSRRSYTIKTIIFRATSLLFGTLATSDFIFRDWRVPFLILAMSMHTITVMTGGIFLQYVPNRYGWTISQANYLFSLRAAASIVALLVLLPKASKWLVEQKKQTAFAKDLLLCRISFVLVTAGVLTDGLAPVISLLIFGVLMHTLGSGAVSLARSLLSSLVKPTEVARLFAVMSMLDTVSMLVASPMLASLYATGLRLGGGWVGLPYLVSGTLFSMATAAIWASRLDRGEVKTGGVEEGDVDEGTALISLAEE